MSFEGASVESPAETEINGSELEAAAGGSTFSSPKNDDLKSHEIISEAGTPTGSNVEVKDHQDSSDASLSVFMLDSDEYDKDLTPEEVMELDMLHSRFLQDVMAASRPLSARKEYPTVEHDAQLTGTPSPANPVREADDGTPISWKGKSRHLDKENWSDEVEERLLDEIEVLERQKEYAERENQELRQRLSWVEDQAVAAQEAIRQERDAAIGEKAVADQRARDLELTASAAFQCADASDAEKQLINSKLALSEAVKQTEALKRDKLDLQRRLAQMTVEREHAREAQTDAEKQNEASLLQLSMVKSDLAEEKARREDAEVHLHHAIREKVEAQEELEEIRLNSSCTVRVPPPPFSLPGLAFGSSGP